jgi:hypothetical protein
VGLPPRPVDSTVGRRGIEHDPNGIPYLAPEIVLLFKAKHAARDKDAADFARALPLLDAQRRQWLADALRIVHPGHDWLTLVVDR